MCFVKRLSATARSRRPDRAAQGNGSGPSDRSGTAIVAIRFVHAADLHLDSPLLGLSSYPGAPVEALRGATRQACESLVELCIDEQAELLVIAGDLFDGEWPHFGTGLFFAAEMSRLREAGVQVVILRGNHDAASAVTKRVPLPDNVKLLRHSSAESYRVPGTEIVVHGQSFASAAVTENLAAKYPARVPDVFNIGLLHTSMTGAANHEPYAPCTLEDLLGLGYDYWALGHVHERREVHADPPVVFSGCLQGRHVREPGAKGATLVDVVDGEVRASHRVLDHVRWVQLHVDVSEALDLADVHELVSEVLRAAVREVDGRLLACRLVLEGASAAHGELARGREQLDVDVRALATDAAIDGVWVESVRLQTRERGAPRVGDDVLSEAVAVARELRGHPEELASLAAEFRALAAKLPPELRRGPEPFDPTDVAVLEAMLSEIERALPALLTGGP